MIKLSQILRVHQSEFFKQYGAQLSAAQIQVFNAISQCRQSMNPHGLLYCNQCKFQQIIPHSCGNRHCPQYQWEKTSKWIEEQQQKSLPCEYFMLTFTLPSEFRALASVQGKKVFSAMMAAAAETIKVFCSNDQRKTNPLRGKAGFIAVLHTHNRRLDFHPHIHVVMPALTIDEVSKQQLIRRRKDYLFSEQAMAKVYRGKLLAALVALKLILPTKYAEKWVVHIKSVGNGQMAVAYLGRYLFRGVITENNIVAYDGKIIKFRYQNSQTRKIEIRTLEILDFLRLILQHVLPKGFVRVRSYGFLHANAKKILARIWIKLKYLSSSDLTENHSSKKTKLLSALR